MASPARIRGGGTEPDAVFRPAPAAGRVRRVSTVVFCLFPLMTVIFALAVPREDRAYPWVVASPLLAGLPAVALIFFLARIRCYRLEGDALLVERTLLRPRVPLEGLASVGHEPGATRGARKVLGNDGVGAMAGRFRSAHLGRFHAYVTSGDHAVVLRWPDRTLVVSPQRTREFVEAVRRRAGLRT